MVGESVATDSELTVVMSIRACSSLPRYEYFVSRWWPIASLHRRLRVCANLHKPLILQPKILSCRQHTVQYSVSFDKHDTQSTQCEELISFCFEKKFRPEACALSVVSCVLEITLRRTQLYHFHSLSPCLSLCFISLRWQTKLSLLPLRLVLHQYHHQRILSLTCSLCIGWMVKSAAHGS